MAKPKQDRLPGTEDNRIAPLHKTALEYVDKRDARQEMLAEEIKLKEKLRDLMHKHEKETYLCDGVEIRLVMEEESVKVKVKQAKPEIEEI